MGGSEKTAGAHEREHAFAPLCPRRIGRDASYDARHQAQNEAFEVYARYPDHNSASACADGGGIISYLTQEFNYGSEKT